MHVAVQLCTAVGANSYFWAPSRSRNQRLRRTVGLTAALGLVQVRRHYHVSISPTHADSTNFAPFIVLWCLVYLIRVLRHATPNKRRVGVKQSSVSCYRSAGYNLRSQGMCCCILDVFISLNTLLPTAAPQFGLLRDKQQLHFIAPLRLVHSAANRPGILTEHVSQHHSGPASRDSEKHTPMAGSIRYVQCKHVSPVRAYD